MKIVIKIQPEYGLNKIVLHPGYQLKEYHLHQNVITLIINGQHIKVDLLPGVEVESPIGNILFTSKDKTYIFPIHSKEYQEDCIIRECEIY